MPVLRNLLSYGDLTFRDFMEIALYHPECGYYSGDASPVGQEGDYVTAPAYSPVFAFALGRLVREFLSHSGDGPSTIVDIGCGDGSLIYSLAIESGEAADAVRFVGVDRALGRIRPEFRERVRFETTIDAVPGGGAHLVLSNEFFDALPFSRLVMRGEHLHELSVREGDDGLEWSEHEAPAEYDDYFAERNVRLADGQFADVSLEWGASYADICRLVDRGLVVTFDYGYPVAKLFHPRARRFGTAAAYSHQRVSRDLLAVPGEQDITAHINFTDLIRVGEAAGFRTRFFDRQAKFLLSLGITEHELFSPAAELGAESVAAGVELFERRDAARQLVLPDSIGHDIRTLVQARGMGDQAWSFEHALF